MSELLEKQFLFGRSVPLLLGYMALRGYQYKLGRGKVDAATNAVQGGIPASLHLDGLAIDIDLFKDGVYLQETSSHLIFGQFWKGLGPGHCWGGDFKPKPDGNHYSITYQGRK